MRAPAQRRLQGLFGAALFRSRSPHKVLTATGS